MKPETFDITWAPRQAFRPRRAAALCAGLLLALAAGAALRVHASARQAEALAQATARDAVRSVTVGLPGSSGTARRVTLPGTLRGRTEAALHARVSGYLKAWHRDIGDRVRQGELLAELDTPEQTQELLQARAGRAQLASKLALAESSFERWQGLREQGIVSAQALDERSAALIQARADLAASDANIRRLEELQSFRRIVAPFDGVVVRRNAEVGALVSAGNTGSAQALFQLAQTDSLRVAIAVPQAYAGQVQAGGEVELALQEQPGTKLKGRVERSAGALDPDSRTLSVEVVLPNPDGRLMPGLYVEATLALGGASGTLTVPAGALQFRQDGPRVAVVDEHDRIALRPLRLGRDLGRTVEVLSGLTARDRIVLHPHDAIAEGEPVVAVASAK